MKKRIIKNCYWLGLHYTNGDTDNIYIGQDLKKQEEIIKNAPKGTVIELFYSRGENGKKFRTISTLKK